MKLADLLTDSASSMRAPARSRSAASRRTAARSSPATVRRGGGQQGGRPAFRRRRRWRRARRPIMAERVPDDAAAQARCSCGSSNARRALALAAARFYPRQPDTIAAVTGTSGKTSVAAFTRQIWAAPGDAGGEHRHHRRGLAEARGLRLADHARSGGAAPHARRAGRRGRHASGDGGVVARARPASARRRARRGRRLHQSVARPSRLSSDRRGLSRGQAAAVRGAGASRRRGGDRRRSRARGCGGRGGEAAAGCSC